MIDLLTTLESLNDFIERATKLMNAGSARIKELTIINEDLAYRKDGAYRERDRLVAALGKAAIKLGGRCWLAKHDPADESWDKEWMHIVYILLPGETQMSWHIADHEVYLFDEWTERDVQPYDGHSTQDKYSRLEDWTMKLDANA